MPVSHPPTRTVPRATWPATPSLPSVDPMPLGADLAGILNDLVDAIDVRESFDPESSGWDTAAVIRRLERDLARAWIAARVFDQSPEGARRWPH
jgi:hypothetical protein